MADDLDTVVKIPREKDRRFVCRVAAEQWLKANGWKYNACSPLGEGRMLLTYQRGIATASVFVP